jgi:hypothetical protein
MKPKDHFTNGKDYKIRVKDVGAMPDHFAIHRTDQQRGHRLGIVLQMMRENRTLRQIADVLAITPVAAGVWIRKWCGTSATYRNWNARRGERISNGHTRGTILWLMNKADKLAAEIEEISQNVDALKRERAEILTQVKELSA